ncbi:unnamed protein product [Psylliodes chrysocephalus]|uniref:Uncharacterized protein n=1 Tax=Psylliodes chrysocephalus TaxID=3402493 RepID=A0A9P0GCE9_9CUCU|nr:unnamed protein product [Psylliodes chrysocephala]
MSSLQLDKKRKSKRYQRMFRYIFCCPSFKEDLEDNFVCEFPPKLVSSSSQYEENSISIKTSDESEGARALFRCGASMDLTSPDSDSKKGPLEADMKLSLDKLDNLIVTLDHIYQFYSKESAYFKKQSISRLQEAESTEGSNIDSDLTDREKIDKPNENSFLELQRNYSNLSSTLGTFTDTVMDHITSIKSEIKELKILFCNIKYATDTSIKENNSAFSCEDLQSWFEKKEHDKDKWFFRAEEYKFFEAKMRASNFCKFHRLSQECDKKINKSKSECSQIKCI